MERRGNRRGLLWAAGTGGVFGLALAEELGVSLLHMLGCGLLCALMGLALWTLVRCTGVQSAGLSRWEWLLLSLPALGLGAAVLVVPLTGLLSSLFFGAITLLSLFLLRRHGKLTGTVLVMALLLCWFGCYCVLSNLCISPDSYSYYEMARSLFTDFGRVSTIRQYVEFTDYGISFPYFYPLLLAVVDGLSGMGMYSGILLNVFLSMAAALLFVPLSRRLSLHSWPGVMAAIALLTNRKYLSEVLSGRAIPAAVLCVVVILLLLSGPKRWERKNLVLVGLMAGISMVTRFDNLTVVGFVGLCVLLSGKGRWGRTVCYSLGALIPLLPWCVYSVTRFGTLWISDNSGTLTMVDITVPQRFFLPGETAATLVTAPDAWFHALGGRFRAVLLLLVLTFVSTQVLLPGVLLAVRAVRGRLTGARSKRAGAQPCVWISVLILIFYALKTLAYCLVGYETARYHAETVVLVIFALCCLGAPYVGRRTAKAGVALYLLLALWAGLLYSSPLSQTIRPLCGHPSYAGCLNFGYQKQDESWRALWERISGQPLVTDQVAHRPDWVAALEELVDDENARLFFLSSNGDPYAYGAYTGQKTFAFVVNLNEERCFYLMDHYIQPTHIVISSGNDLPWVDTLDGRYGLSLQGEVDGNLLYRVEN